MRPNGSNPSHPTRKLLLLKIRATKGIGHLHETWSLVAKDSDDQYQGWISVNTGHQTVEVKKRPLEKGTEHGMIVSSSKTILLPVLQNTFLASLGEVFQF